MREQANNVGEVEAFEKWWEENGLSKLHKGEAGIVWKARGEQEGNDGHISGNLRRSA